MRSCPIPTPVLTGSGSWGLSLQTSLRPIKVATPWVNRLTIKRKDSITVFADEASLSFAIELEVPLQALSK